MSDFERYHKDGKTYPSLAEKVLISCCKKIEEKNYLDLVDYFILHLDSTIKIYEDNIWLKYHKGKLLLLIKRKEEAKEFIIPVVREKQSESWAWGLLGQAFSEDDIDKSIACLIKGIEVCRDENFITNIRLELTKALIKSSLLPEAKYQLESLINFKKEKGQKLSDEIINYIGQEWFSSTQSSNFNDEIYEEYNIMSLSILFDSLPWIKAIVIGKDDNSEKVFLLLENKIETNVKFNLNDKIKNLEIGIPLKVKAGNEIGRITIYAVELREGESWDLIPEEIGIIDDVNYEKNLSHIILNPNKDCILFHDKFEEIKNIPIGSFVKCKTKSIMKDQKLKTIIFTCKRTEEIPSNRIYNEFEGVFIDPTRRNNVDYDYDDDDYDEKKNFPEKSSKDIVCSTFGFVNSEQTYYSIYVHKSIVQKNLLIHDDKVKCKVVTSMNKKGKRGWRALSLNKI